MPRAIIIAGPNGAGKTTFAFEYLPAEGNCPRFFNADLIAAGLAPFRPETAAVAASRLMLAHIRRAVAERRDFAIETTLAGRAYLRMIREWKAAGYHVDLIFLELPSVELAIARVRLRVAQGGHAVPEGDIRRRFERGSQNIHAHYQPAADSCQSFNTAVVPPVLTGRWAVCGKATSDGNHRLNGISTALRRAVRRAAESAIINRQDLLLFQRGQIHQSPPQKLICLSSTDDYIIGRTMP